MAHEVESMFSARELPWHGVGTVTEGVLTAAEALAAGGLDWEVKLCSLYAQVGKDKKKVQNRFAVVRQSDGEVLGTVGRRYTPFQNREAFAFADSLVDDGGAKYETAGSLKGGRVVFLSMKVPGDMKVAGEDPIDLYLVLSTSHDGTKAVRADVTPIRPVCMNTLTAAIFSARQSWQMLHTRSMEGRIQEAREALRLTFDYADSFVQFGDLLVSTKVTDEDIMAVLEASLPDKPKTADVIEGIFDTYRESPFNGYQGTAWGAYNAVTEYFDHVHKGRTVEGSYISSTDGAIARARTAAASNLRSLALSR